jgi:hypothetical protein
MQASLSVQGPTAICGMQAASTQVNPGAQSASAAQVVLQALPAGLQAKLLGQATGCPVLIEQLPAVSQ